MNLDYLRCYIMESIAMGNISRRDFGEQARRDNINIYSKSFIQARESLLKEGYILFNDFYIEGTRFNEWISSQEVNFKDEQLHPEDDIALCLMHLLEDNDPVSWGILEETALRDATDSEADFRYTLYHLAERSYIKLIMDDKISKGPKYDDWSGSLELNDYAKENWDLRIGLW